MQRVSVPVLVAAACCLAAAAQEPDHADEDEHTDEHLLEEVVVVGTRRSARSPGTLPVPVDVLDGADLAAYGNGDMLDALASVVPSYNVGREPISDAATLIRPANLRGLPADSTLVLVNGKRRHRGAVIGEFVAGINKGAQAVDIAPLAAIALKRVEVLRDGASAQYGSDAIAGVLNFVLENDPHLRRLRMQFGSTYEGDGDQITVSGGIGSHLGERGFATLSFELQDSAPTSRGSQDPQATYLIENGYEGVADPVVIWGSPDVEDDFKVLVNAAVEAGTGELYGFGTWSGRDVDGSFFYRNPNTRSGVFADGTGNLLVADLTPGDGDPCRTVPIVDGLANRSALAEVVADPNCFAFNEWFPSGFTPRFGGEVSDTSVVVGWRGHRSGGFGYDFSVSAGRNEVVYRIRKTVNASYGPNTPTAFDLGSQIQFERLVNADFTLPIDIGAASDLHIAFGVQHHEETFEMSAGDTESWAPGGFETQGFSVGSNGFQGFSADVAGRFSRKSHSAYVQLDLDVTDRWLVDGAFRYERYGDFGSTTNGKFATRFEVAPTFTLRGSVSTGFRAPSIGQSNLRRAATTVVDGQLVESLTLPPTNPVAILKGGRQQRDHRGGPGPRFRLRLGRRTGRHHPRRQLDRNRDHRSRRDAVGGGGARAGGRPAGDAGDPHVRLCAWRVGGIRAVELLRRRLRAPVQLRVLLDRHGPGDGAGRRGDVVCRRDLRHLGGPAQLPGPAAGQAPLRGRLRIPRCRLPAESPERLQRRELLPARQRGPVADALVASR